MDSTYNKIGLLVSINAYKGSLSTVEATDTVAEVFSQFGFNSQKCYIADGGDGTVEVAASIGATLEYVETYDPLLRPIKAPIAWIDKTAIIEMAKASGLALIDQKEKNPLNTTSFGTGILIKHAVLKGANKIILGIGGSATVDGGIGMLAALDFKILDAKGHPAWMGGGMLSNIKSIAKSPIVFPDITIASDVTNPLLGINGAANVFGPQKGADSPTIEILEKGLEHLNNVTKKILNKDISNIEGAGAAGGIGGFALAYLSAKITPGAELFMDLGKFNDKAHNAKILVTGEGALDRQTSHGKAPFRVAKRFKEINKQGIVIAFAGMVLDRSSLKPYIDVSLSIANKPMPLKDSLEKTKELLKDVACEIATILKWHCRNEI